MGWWITLGILALLAVLPLGVAVRYDEDGALVRIIAGPVKITLFPRPKKDKKPKKEKKPKDKKSKEKKSAANKLSESKPAAPETTSEPKPQQPQLPPPAEKKAPAKKEKKAKPEKKDKKGGSITDFLPLVKVLFDFLGDFKRKLRVNLLEVKVVLAGDDPCDLATNYGRAWAALGNLMPRLERFLVIQKRDIDIQCDFTASSTTIFANLELTITLGRLLAAVFVFIFHAVVELLKILIKRKGGASHEPESSQHAE